MTEESGWLNVHRKAKFAEIISSKIDFSPKIDDATGLWKISYGEEKVCAEHLH
jgi:hypothetical protein